MAQSILELIFKTAKSGTGGKAAAAELKELKGTVGEVSQGLLGFNAASLTAVGALTAAGAAAIKSVTDYQAYAESMRGLAAITGTGVEETSRLVQAFDDMGIEQEKVSTVLESAARKGFVMSIENVAKLADEYNGLSTQEEKNALLTDKLGKSGLAMAKAFEQGGQAIRDAAEAQADGMILTEENIRQAEELRIAQDNLNDSWTALSNSGAKVLVPILTDVLDVTQKNIEEGISWKNVLSLIGPVNTALAITELFKADAMRKSNAAGKELLDMTSPMTEGIAGYSGVLENTVPVIKDATIAQQSMKQGMQELGQIVDITASAQQGLMSGVQYSTQQFLEQKGILDQLSDASKRLQDAQANWAKTAGTDVKSALEEAGLKGEDFNLALGAIDSQMGTNFVQEQKYKDNIKQLVDQYARTKDIGLFKEGLASTKTAFQKLDEEVINAQKEVTDLQLRLDTLVSKTYIVGVQVSSGTSGILVGTEAAAPGSGKNKQQANGGTFTVPPGYPNDSFQVGFSSGETVTTVNERMRATGTAGEAGSGGVVIQNVNINNGMDMAEFETRLTAVLRRRG